MFNVFFFFFPCNNSKNLFFFPNYVQAGMALTYDPTAAIQNG